MCECAVTYKESSVFDGTVPLHFYGELVKTPEGRMILEAKGHFQEFVDFVRAHGMEEEDLEVITKLKSILWAVVSIPDLILYALC